MLSDRARPYYEHYETSDGSMNLRLVYIATLLCIFLSSVGVHAENLVQNPNFDANLDHWNLLGEPAEYAADDGSPLPGSALIYNQYMVAGLASDCFAIDPTQKYVASAMIKFLFGHSAFFAVSVFSGQKCGGDGTRAAGSSFGQPSQDWIFQNGGVVSIPDSSIGSAQIFFMTSGYVGDLVSFGIDSVFFGPDSVFASGFDN
jgi:hypothetical protein